MFVNIIDIYDSYVYQRYFIRESEIQASDYFLQLLENQISNVSNARLRPIRNAKVITL